MLLRDTERPRLIFHILDVENLAIEHLLAGADVPDSLKEFLPVPTATGSFEAVVVKGEALDDVFFENRCRPDSELRGYGGLDPVSDRDDHVKVVVLRAIILPVGGSC